MKAIIGVVGLALVSALFAACDSKPTLEKITAKIEKLGGKFSNDGKELFLIGTKITDAGLAHLEGMKGIEWLNLKFTRVTDAGLAHLEGMAELGYLYLKSAKITDAGVEKLQAALPKCEIVR